MSVGAIPPKEAIPNEAATLIACNSERLADLDACH
jgi:hypothetical protein